MAPLASWFTTPPRCNPPRAHTHTYTCPIGLLRPTNHHLHHPPVRQVAALFYPETLRFRRAQVRVVAEEPGEGSHALGGFSFVDSRHTAKVPGSQNCWVGEAHDAGAALSIMVQDLKMLVEAAPMPISHPAYSVSSPRAMVASGGGGGGGGGGGVPVAVVSSW